MDGRQAPSWQKLVDDLNLRPRHRTAYSGGKHCGHVRKVLKRCREYFSILQTRKWIWFRFKWFWAHSSWAYFMFSACDMLGILFTWPGPNKWAYLLGMLFSWAFSEAHDSRLDTECRHRIQAVFASLIRSALPLSFHWARSKLAYPPAPLHSSLSIPPEWSVS